MSLEVEWGLFLVAAYLLGSIPTGLIFAKAKGIDLRATGSGNIGATNVARTLGKKIGIIVLILDALKGAIPVAALFSLNYHEQEAYLLTATGIAAISGHCFPVWLRFKGGKGVATSLGVFLVTAPIATAIAVGIFIAIVVATKIVSAGSGTASITLPVAMHFLGHSWPAISMAIAVTFIVLVKHRANFARIVRGEENKI